MPGFSRMEQARLARIVIAQPRQARQGAGRGLRGGGLEAGVRAAPRFAHPAQPHRREAAFLRVAADAGGFDLDLPQSWLDDNPLSADALEAEARHWKSVGMKLDVRGLSDKKVSVLKQVR
jgi:exopolyphosphatase/guanosine-5'-triphosphate,3'-diphosphate pyrophosphatase